MWTSCGLISWAAVDAIVQRYRQGCRALYQCADYARDRSEMMASYCNDVISLGFKAMVRQKGGLSSFHIPRRRINHPDWAKRYAGKREDDPDHNRAKREERIALENHAREQGCKLMINPFLAFERWGPEAKLSRLRTLIEFLASMEDDQCAVAIRSAMPYSDSVTILGDWFCAESVASEVGRGYRQTIFSRHAPTILNRIEAFDEEFEELLDEAGVHANESRRVAMELMEEMIRGGS